MNVKIFTIRADSEHLANDQNHLNSFLETVSFIKSDTHFIENEASFWSVLVHYENASIALSKSKNDKKSQESELNIKQLEDLKNLKLWRKQKADLLKVAAYLICFDSELISVALKKPTTFLELKKIKGFGELKSEKYGNDIISVLNAT